MRGPALLYLTAMLVWWTAPAAAAETPCEACHRSYTPGIVTDWEMSAHAANDVTCIACHGKESRIFSKFMVFGLILLIVALVLWLIM